MGRRFTLDEYLKAFTDEQTESVEDAITVRMTDAEVRDLGFVFIELMGGILESLRKPPRRRQPRIASKVKRNHDPFKEQFGDQTIAATTDNKDIIH